MRPEHIHCSSSTMPHFILTSMIVMAWLSQAQDQEIFPAKIFSNINKHKLEFTCSTYGLKEKQNSVVYIYLCRNGVGIDTKSSRGDASFYIDGTAKDSTGNYSCVFSVNKKNLKDVKGYGINFIFITVNDSFTPAEIALQETSVKTGSDVEFQCTSGYKPPKTNQKEKIYAYLSKNSTVIQTTIWDTVKNKARFTLKEVTMQDAGTYICFLKAELCPFPKKVHGINKVNLHITDAVWEMNVLRLLFSIVVIIFACFIVIFDIKTRSRPHSKCTIFVKAKDRNDS